jgi:hypothetical protein
VDGCGREASGCTRQHFRRDPVCCVLGSDGDVASNLSTARAQNTCRAARFWPRIQPFAKTSGSPANFCPRIHSRVLPRAEGSSMSFVAWKILRKLPRSLLRVGVVFLLVSAAHA